MSNINLLFDQILFAYLANKNAGFFLFLQLNEDTVHSVTPPPCSVVHPLWVCPVKIPRGPTLNKNTGILRDKTMKYKYTRNYYR